MYEHHYTIHKQLCDQLGNLSPYGVFWLLNDIMERNANSYGLGTDYHLKRNLAWVLVAYDVHISGMLKQGDRAIVGTLPYAFKKMFGFRKYHIKDNHGNVILTGKAKFVLVNINTKQLIKPPLDMLKKFTDAKKEPASLPFDKIPHEVNTPKQKQFFIIDKELIDVNGHLNNANYVKLATELNAQPLTPPQRMRVEYKKEVFAGDKVTWIKHHHPNGVYHVSMLRQGEVCCELLFEKL